ncbi:putative exosome subunit [Thermoplasmatales archaeon BRNA1]|nr:putative exosome subunit [Thermoplasmatales archaeon BRNA1]
MQATFHWLRVETFCYATEKEDLVAETFASVSGTDEFRTDISESEHGNQMLILQAMMTKQREQDAVFVNLGQKLTGEISEKAEDMVDDDCVFYLRLDKQKAVCGEYAIAHHGDVISVTGKIASNPARKEIAVENLRKFLGGLFSSPITPQASE